MTRGRAHASTRRRRAARSRRIAPRRHDLLDIIAHVRTRWRLKLALRGAMHVRSASPSCCSCSPPTAWSGRGSAARLDHRVARRAARWRSSPSVFWFLVRPLRRQVSDEQVALYLEEHEPSLQATLLSAVEASRSRQPPNRRRWSARWSSRRSRRASRMDASRRVEQTPLRRYGVALAAVAAVALLVVLLGPAFLRNALSALLLRLGERRRRRRRTRIDVTPGQRLGAEGRRSDGHREAARLHDRGRRADGAPDADGSVRGAAAHPQRGRHVRRHALRRHRAARLLRRRRRRAVAGLHAEGRRRAVRAAARPRISTIRPTPASSRRRSRTAATSPCCAAPKCACSITPTMKTPGGRIALNDKDRSR